MRFLNSLILASSAQRDGDEADVSSVNVGQAAVEMIGDERTTVATFFPIRSEHEMVDNQLATAGE